jgi:signal transduction histidine kinase/ActR/RegA family two-component response regulator
VKPATRDSELDGLEYWRHRILSAVLIALAGLGLVAYVPSMGLALVSGYLSIAVGDTIAYAWILWLAARRSLSVRSRALQLVLLCNLLAVMLLVVVGPNGAGLYWLGAATTMASLLLGPRAAVVSLVVAASVVAAVALGIYWKVFAWTAAFDHPGALWLVLGANALFIDTAVALSVAALLRGLEASVQRRLAAEERMREAQKLEAIGTLAGGIAHELNNMLVPILADAEALAAGVEGREEALRITRAALRARDLVRRILVFGRRDAPERAPLDFGRVLTEAIELLRAALPAQIEILVEVDTRGALVRAHETEIHQIVMNLGSNAIQAMPRGGTLSIRATSVEQASRVRIRVTDSGVGMDESTREHAIDPFFTTKAPGEGTGLGLSTVHGIALALGGGVVITSELGVGTTVEVELAATEAAIAVVVATPASVAPSAGELLLLVDDEPAVLDAHARMLVRCGYRVLRAASAERATALLREHGSAVRAMITDLNMPHMDGVELAEHARGVVPGLPVVLVTGYLEDADRDRAAAAGAGDVLIKPFGRQELAAVVHRLLTARD